MGGFFSGSTTENPPSLPFVGKLQAVVVISIPENPIMSKDQFKIGGLLYRYLADFLHVDGDAFDPAGDAVLRIQ